MFGAEGFFNNTNSGLYSSLFGGHPNTVIKKNSPRHIIRAAHKKIRQASPHKTHIVIHHSGYENGCSLTELNKLHRARFYENPAVNPPQDPIPGSLYPHIAYNYIIKEHKIGKREGNWYIKKQRPYNIIGYSDGNWSSNLHGVSVMVDMHAGRKLRIDEKMITRLILQTVDKIRCDFPAVKIVTTHDFVRNKKPTACPGHLLRNLLWNMKPHFYERGMDFIDCDYSGRSGSLRIDRAIRNGGNLFTERN